jgi:hypothetical protein
LDQYSNSAKVRFRLQKFNKLLNNGQVTKMSHRKRTLGVLLALATFAAFPLLGADDSRFSIAVGSHDNLLILGPNREQIADMAAPTLQRAVAVGTTSFRVSYGRDANGQLTAILTPSDSSAVTLRFSAGGKSIDADKAVVTLTFSPNLKGVLVDPGYVGTVEVDSHLMRAHSLADDLPLEANPSTQAVTTEVTPAPAPMVAPPTASAPSVTEPSSASASIAATPEPAPAAVPSPAPNASTSVVSPSAPPSLASQLTPMLAPPANAAPTTAPTTSRYQPIQDTLAASTAPVQRDVVKPMKLFWSEPVTAPDGTAPAVALDEIKLVELHGDVTVVLPSGETQAGTDGMVVPSGATVRTAENSSVALFMGGVNSARMMPKCELVVTQTLADNTRTDLLNLHYGAVFSRIGHRDGETENYSVSTPEGTSDAQTSDMLAFRGNPADFRGAVTNTTMRLAIDNRNLLAWNPVPSHGLISDVAQSDLGILTPMGYIPDTYFYYTGGYKLSVNANAIKSEVLSNFMPNATTSNTEPDYVLQAILLTLQPYNLKLTHLLDAINNGTETSAQLTYYHNLITVFFDKQAPGIVNDILNHPKGWAHVLNQDSAMLWQDLREFQLNELTPGIRQ